MFLFVCVLKNIDHDSVKSFEITENQLFHFPSQLKRKKKNALDTEKIPLYPLSPHNQFDAHLFPEEEYWEAEVAEKEKDSVPISLEKDVEKNLVYSSGFQVGDTAHSTCVSGIAWWFVLCCAMGKMAADSLLHPNLSVQKN